MTLPHLADARAFHDADRLIATYGPDAASEAAARAEHSRGIGNGVRFCHWRQIERLIALLAGDRPVGMLQ